ncbi:GntR family transcriptional regulator [Clostridium sp. Marseille-P299]|uniref:GntR family transcriptional regulator n=1 Tax=Clostridium sp. Marseille-P299 TaxID=1805477 RepID=UPI00082D07FA|nr:GntR family transcriptional regulator [Clostridium sp. Marseille-P299]
MDIVISNSSGRPIYDQIVSQIKNQIMSGELTEGEALPSMRVLAKELRISVITTKRAYEELEREGFIVSMTGKGSFVASKNTEIIREEQLKQIEEYMTKAVEIASTANVSLEELTQILEYLYRGE